jgi:NAD(P)H-nitrite reductase large subunit
VLEEEGGRYRKLVLENDRVVGAILLGYSREVAPVRTAISRGYDVGGVLDDLHAGRWDVLAGLSGERPLLAGAPAIAG